jgi:putative acetyltransferase
LTARGRDRDTAPVEQGGSSGILVRRATVADAEAFARTMSDADVYPFLLQLPLTDTAFWQQRLSELLAPGKTDLLLVAEIGDAVVGNAGLHPASAALRRRHVGTLGMAVAPSAQRRGVGTALLASLLDYADNWAQLLRVELEVYTDNAPAIALYRKFGFEVEGTHRCDTLRDGRFVDSHTMARLHPNPPTLR